MARISAWWRRLGTALAALVLTVLTLGPGLDGLICRDEGGLSASAAEMVVAAGVDSHEPDHGLDGGPCVHGPCVHGHCHHGGPYVATDLAAAETLHDLTRAGRAPPRGRVPTSDPQFGLMRPPRA